ncbi:MAG: hypothetical protein K6T75_01275 [Acetobacteraceae bacterium]|nr:hypothetical protein [Acetobacteraceae bacterium]
MSETQIETPIGPLSITDVYMEYDGPRVFRCSSQAGETYLGLWVEETPALDRWLLVPISVRRLALVETGALPLAQAILEAEGGWVWIITFGKRDERLTGAEKTPCTDIDPRHLPDADACLTGAASYRVPDEPPLVKATRTGREVIDLYFDGEGADRNEVEADQLGSTLLRLQSLTRTLGHKAAPIVGPLPRTVVEDNTLMVTGMVAGSFGVRLESRCLSDLFGETRVAVAVSRLMDLLEASRKGNLQEALPAIGPRAASGYRYLLQALSGGGSGLKAHWASPSKKQRQVVLSLETVRSALAVLEEQVERQKQVFTCHGRLVGVMTDRRRFKFVSDTGDTFEGVYGPQVEGETLQMRLSKEMGGVSATAQLQETMEITPGGEERFKYELLSIAPDSAS